MTDSIVQLPEDGSGKKLDTEQLVVGSNTVQRERMQIAGALAAAIAAVDNSDPAALAYGLAVRLVGPDSIQTVRVTSAAIAAGGEVDLDSTQITSSKTGKLMQVVVTSSVAIKADLKTVLNGVESSALHTMFTGHDRQAEFRPVTKEAFTVAHDATAGLDAFRMTITNEDTTAAADVYATFIWDEV